jgi:glucokinase
MEAETMNPVIVADIGGTNARFGLATGFDAGSEKVLLEQRRQYLSGDFPDFGSVFRCYGDSLGGPKPKQACIAVAGPVKGDQVSMTNLDWNISGPGTREAFELDRFELINDYSAQIYSTFFLGPDSLSPVCRGKIKPHAPRCVVGPGTGLGVAAIVPANGHRAILSGEGGHITLASTGRYENQVIQQLAPEQGRVSAETVLSGPGIHRIYRAICAIEGYPKLADSPADITGAALSGSDPAATAACSTFFRLLGGMVGDMILTFGAEGGAFLAGGILPRIENLLQKSEFERCLKDKGVMSHYLEDISVALITADDAALVGAAAWFYGAAT